MTIEKYLLKLGEINASFKRNLIKISENTWIHYTIIQYIFVSIVIQLFYDRLNETFIDVCPRLSVAQMLYRYRHKTVFFIILGLILFQFKANAQLFRN